MRAAHGVGVHPLEQHDVVVRQRSVERAPRRRPERVAVEAAQHHLLAVDIDAVARAHLDRAETDGLDDLMDRLPLLLEGDDDAIEVGRLGAPGLDAGDDAGEARRLPAVTGADSAAPTGCAWASSTVATTWPAGAFSSVTFTDSVPSARASAPTWSIDALGNAGVDRAGRCRRTPSSRRCAQAPLIDAFADSSATVTSSRFGLS